MIGSDTRDTTKTVADASAMMVGGAGTFGGTGDDGTAPGDDRGIEDAKEQIEEAGAACELK